MKLTINSAIALEQALKGRVSELKTLRSEVSKTETRTFFDGPKSETKIEPQFDVKKVDTKIVELSNMLFKLNAAIKEANARTVIDGLDVDVDKLLEPLQ